MSQDNTTATSPSGRPVMDRSSIDYTVLDRVDPHSPAGQHVIKDLARQERELSRKADEYNGRGTIQPQTNMSVTLQYADGNEPVRNHVGNESNSVSSGIEAAQFVMLAGVQFTRTQAEELRLRSTPSEWKAMTGLEYTPIKQGPRVPGSKIETDGADDQHEGDTDVFTDGDQALDDMAAKEAADAAEAERKQQEADDALVHYDRSAVEQFYSRHIGADKVDAIVREVAKTGEITAEMAANHWMTDGMMNDITAHYEGVANNMLAAENSCVSYVENGLDDQDQTAFRQALLSRDMETVRRLGGRARNNIASMNYAAVSDFLSHSERVQLGLHKEGNRIMIQLPDGTVSDWATSINRGLISFK